MNQKLEPSHGEIISQEDWDRLYSKIKGSHTTSQTPFSFIKKGNSEEDKSQFEAWLKKNKLKKIYSSSKEVIDGSILCSIAPIKELPKKQQTNVGKVIFFIKR